jgi:Ca2+:H+ antiporter
MRRSSTWSTTEPNDIEAAVDGVPYLLEVSHRLQQPDSEETAVERQSTRHASQEEKPRQRFAKFKKHDQTEEDDDRSARPQLKHMPFTLRNQLAATIFNHWVRALLLLTPVGLAVHYAHLNATTDFLVNFFAVLPLTDMFGQGLVELKMWSQDLRAEWIAYVIFGYEQAAEIHDQ